MEMMSTQVVDAEITVLVGLSKVFNSRKEFKEFAQTQQRNMGITQHRHNHRSLRNVAQKSIGIIKFVL